MISLSASPACGPASSQAARLASAAAPPVRVKRLAKIIELTEILHEPVEHVGLHTSNGADSKRRSPRLQGLRLALNP